MIRSNHRVEAAGRSSSLTPQASSLLPTSHFRLPTWPAVLWSLVLAMTLAAAALAGEPGAAGDIYTLSRYAVRQYDAVTGHFVGPFVVQESESAEEFALGLLFGGAQDNSIFVSSTNSKAIIEYDATNGQFVRVVASGGVLDGALMVRLREAPNGNLLMVTGQIGGAIHEFDLLTGAFIRTVADGLDIPKDCITAPNGHLLVAIRSYHSPDYDEGQILEFDFDTGALIGTFVEEIRNPRAMAFGPNGNLFVVHDVFAAWEFWAQRVSEFDGATGDLIGVVVPEAEHFPHVYDCDELMFGSNGNLFAATIHASSEPGILEYDPATGTLVGQLTPGLHVNIHGFAWKPQMTPTYPPPQVSAFASDPAGNCDGGLAVATVTGTGLVPGAALRLSMSGEPDIAVTPTPTGFDPDTSITAEFTSGGAAPGWWDLELTYPDGQSDVLAGAIEIIDETPCPPPVVSGFSPPAADNCSVLRDAVVTGNGFFPGTTVKLVRSGQPEFTGHVTDQTPTSITADFWPIHAEPGLWQLVATDPPAIGGASSTLVGALDVQDVPDCRIGRAGHLYVANTQFKNILQFDAVSGEFVCVFAGASEWGEKTELWKAGHLAWAPNGNLLVSQCDTSRVRRAVLEYDGDTGEFLGYVVPPVPDARTPCSLSFGGPDGDLYNQASLDNDDVVTNQYAAVDWSFVGTPLVATPEMLDPANARFLSNGNYLVLGWSISPRPVLREFEPTTFQLVREFVQGYVSKWDLVETPDGCCYLITDSIREAIEVFDPVTLQYVEDFWLQPSCGTQDPCFFEVVVSPRSLAYGPNGSLFVCSQETRVPNSSPGPGYVMTGAIHEFDPVAGVQINMFGQQDDWVTLTHERLWLPQSMAFKPMPGDYASAGGAFNGDWVVDLADCEKLAENMLGPSLRPTNPHALLSFDQDRDGDLDLQDYAAFQRAFGTTLGD